MGTELHNLKPADGARRNRKRVGRGPGSGNGKTAGRGTKGQKKRNNVRRQFEGGQMPIHRRVPKRGFVNLNRVEVHGINVGRLDAVFNDGEEVTFELLRERGLIPKKATVVKILGDGEISKKLKLTVHRVSASARTKIEGAGGSVEIMEAPAAPTGKLQAKGDASEG